MDVPFDNGAAATRIQECAMAYKANLLDRHVLFIPSNGGAPFECFFPADGFQHLCGVGYPGLSKKAFFEEAANRRLDPRRLTPSHRSNTARKLSRLPVLCRIDVKANVAVMDPTDHQGTHADLFCSNMDACIGFIRLGDVYRPKTALAHEPDRHEPGYANLIASVKTMPGEREYVIVCKEPKPRGRISAKHGTVVRSLSSYPHPEYVKPLFGYPF